MHVTFVNYWHVNQWNQSTPTTKTCHKITPQFLLGIEKQNLVNRSTKFYRKSFLEPKQRCLAKILKQVSRFLGFCYRV